MTTANSNEVVRVGNLKAPLKWGTSSGLVKLDGTLVPAGDYASREAAQLAGVQPGQQYRQFRLNLKALGGALHMKNTDAKAIVTLGDLGTGFTQGADGKINVQSVPGITASYLAGADAFTGKVRLKDACGCNVLAEINATNLYDTTGEYVGTVMNFALPALA